MMPSNCVLHIPHGRKIEMNQIHPKTQPKVCFYAGTLRAASYFVAHPNLLIMKHIINHYLSCTRKDQSSAFYFIFPYREIHKQPVESGIATI